MPEFTAKYTQCTFWTPSIPSFDRRLSPDSRLINPYRLFRLTWIVFTTPLHLFLIFTSTLTPIYQPSLFDPNWTLIQKLVYPFLRRIIWAIADVGDPNDLTRSPHPREGGNGVGGGDMPWWARWLEWFTVNVGRGEKVDWKVQRGVRMSKAAEELGLIDDEVFGGKSENDEDAGVDLYWFKRRRSDRCDDGDEDKEKERIAVYFFGGGFVCGSPGEGSRCFKIARETGLTVVGVHYRKAISRSTTFPAALQDALIAYFYLSLDLGYRDVILAGDSAGGALALNVLSYLAKCISTSGLSQDSDPSTNTSSSVSSSPTITNDSPSRRRLNDMLPTGLVMFSPWCDLTLESIPPDNTTDIIMPSICSNSVKAYLNLDHQGDRDGGDPNNDDDPKDEKKKEGDRRKPPFDPTHPYFSPALITSIGALSHIAKAYSLADQEGEEGVGRSLRIFVTMGTTEIFYDSIVHLVDNLRFAASIYDIDKKSSRLHGGTRRDDDEEPGSDEDRQRESTTFNLEVVKGRGEVHAFPLVPEWVSPEAAKTWARLREWFVEGSS